jgi:DDB1-and CUL4-substrate receptor 15, WD repeat
VINREKMFSNIDNRLPGRLAFCLKDAIPHSAIEAGHIFLGFSKCGQVMASSREY